MEKFTVCLWPGAGYILFPFEVEAESEVEALYKAVERAKKEDYSILGFDYSEEKINEMCADYPESKNWEHKSDFVEEHLNYYFMDETGYFLNMDNTKINEGWGLYENSIPMVEENGTEKVSI